MKIQAALFGSLILLVPLTAVAQRSYAGQSTPGGGLYPSRSFMPRYTTGVGPVNQSTFGPSRVTNDPGFNYTKAPWKQASTRALPQRPSPMGVGSRSTISRGRTQAGRGTMRTSFRGASLSRGLATRAVMGPQLSWKFGVVRGGK